MDCVEHKCILKKDCSEVTCCPSSTCLQNFWWKHKHNRFSVICCRLLARSVFSCLYWYSFVLCWELNENQSRRIAPTNFEIKVQCWRYQPRILVQTGTAERNLEWGDPSSRAERAIHLEGSERIGPGKFWKLKLWKYDFLRFGHQILVTVLVTLQDLLTLWPRNAVRNCVCGKKWGGPGLPGPPSSAVPVQTTVPRHLLKEIIINCWLVVMDNF